MFCVQGNDDGQDETNFGSLAAYEVPYVVIPDRFATQHRKELKGNNVVAVIWYVKFLQKQVYDECSTNFFSLLKKRKRQETLRLTKASVMASSSMVSLATQMPILPSQLVRLRGS